MWRRYTKTHQVGPQRHGFAARSPCCGQADLAFDPHLQLVTSTARNKDASESRSGMNDAGNTRWVLGVAKVHPPCALPSAFGAHVTPRDESIPTRRHSKSRSIAAVTGSEASGNSDNADFRREMSGSPDAASAGAIRAELPSIGGRTHAGPRGKRTSLAPQRASVPGSLNQPSGKASHAT